MDLTKRKGKRKTFGNPVALVSVVVLVACLLVIAMSLLRLPDISTNIKSKPSRSMKAAELGKFGKMIVEMLPRDLAFTVFVPSEKAIERDLKLRSAESNGSSAGDDDNVYATLSRVLGFSAVPRKIYSSSVVAGEEVRFDSVSGFGLFISKGLGDGLLVVNRVKAERVDLIESEIVVHIMDGILMDADFEQSVEPDDIEEED